MKAIIESGGKQFQVQKGDVVEVEKLTDAKTVTFEPLMIIDGDKTTIGTPIVKGAVVKAKIIDPAKKAKKVTIVKFRSKKRIYTKNGHRQTQSIIEITDIKLN